MSMNLVFYVTGEVGAVDFPYQTSTDITHEVLNASSKQERLDILKKDMSKWFGTVDMSRLINEIEELMDSPHLELGMV